MTEKIEQFYKGLRLDWTDCHTGKNHHRKGRRFGIDPELRRERLCSDGLLHASRELVDIFDTIRPQQVCIVEGVAVCEDDTKTGLYEYRVLRRMTHKEVGEYLGMNFDLRPVTTFFRHQWRVNEEIVELLRRWASVRASVRDSVRDSVRASVWDSVWTSVRDSVWTSLWDSLWDSVWDSVWAYIGSLFTTVKEWRYIKHKKGEYPFDAGAELIRRGFMPAYDGKKWYLLSGPKFEIVWSGEL